MQGFRAEDSRFRSPVQGLVTWGVGFRVKGLGLGLFTRVL